MIKEEVLRVSHIAKEYRMDGLTFTALHDASFVITQGEFVAIMGPSGSGKSTLMHIIGGLDRPSKGNVYISGVDISRAKDRDLARIRNTSIGFVFQQFNLLRKTSAIANVELPLVYRGTSLRERHERAKSILEEVGLGDKLINLPSQLSGGQQQRVAIARALITDPQILLADEPTGNLDSKSGADILSLFDELHNKGRTIVLVTHETEVARHARRILRIADGRIIEDKKVTRS
ncbi:MAG: ABC transporter ATP-binding protein [Patescibacteria group bacterium]